MPSKKQKTPPNSKSKPSGDAKACAMYIAKVIRNEMEGFHGKGNLTDAQIKELNPIIRNAIYTALYALDNYDKHPGAKSFVMFYSHTIPNYWEEPELIDSFTQGGFNA